MTLALLCRKFAFAEQLAEPSIGGAVTRIGQNVRRVVGKYQPRADQQLRLVTHALPVAVFAIGAHHTGQRVVIGDADGIEAVFAGTPHEFVRMRRPAQEREIAGDADFRIDDHANSPCRNQRKLTTSRR